MLFQETLESDSPEHLHGAEESLMNTPELQCESTGWVLQTNVNILFYLDNCHIYITSHISFATFFNNLLFIL